MSESAASNSSAETDYREALLQIVNTPMLSQCVYVAAKLGIADLLKDGPRSSDELAAATRVHARSLYRILRALAGFGIFAEDEERRFTLTPMAELPHVVESARKNIDTAGLSDRCSCVAIDMFEGVPEGADAYGMANVIQGCDDDDAVKTLGNCRRAMRDGGRVLVVEMLIPGPNELHFSKIIDIEMLVMTDGGRERTRDEYQALYEAAGLRVTRVIPTDSPWSIVEGVTN